MTDSSPPCEILEWDTAFFGVRTARVRGDTLTHPRTQIIDQWCRENQVAWLYFLARSDDAQTTLAAQKAGYQLVDLRLTFERELAGYLPSVTPLVRPFEETDLPALIEIGRSSYTDSRFYYDGKIPRAKCDELFERWTVQSCQGRSAKVLVALDAARPAGYVTIDVDRAKLEARIGLIGVGAAFRGKGIGKRLVDAALSWAIGQNLSLMSVVTQARNIPAQRLYQRQGFVTRSLGLYYHKWFEEKS